MRRKIVFTLALVFLILGLVVAGYQYLAARGNAGYVIIGLGDWVLEASLYLVLAVIGFVYAAFYLGIRLATGAARLPQAMKRRNTARREKNSQDALVAGLIETAEGKWEKAERSLIRHAADSGVPLINYLTAARAAHSRGAHEQREEYLHLARQATPAAELAVSLTRAELQLSSRQFAEALETLTEANRIAPTHAGVLRLMHQVYVQTADWDALHRLMPHLRGGKVLLEADLKLLETETYSALLKEKAATRDAASIREIWRNVPAHIRGLGGIEAIYCAAMIEAGAGAEVEEELRLALGSDWSETLLVLYGCIRPGDPEKHLHDAEAWLAPHPEDPVLYRVLAKLALRLEQVEKAHTYVQKSLELEPSVEAYRLLGDMHFNARDFAGASDLYRKGLLLASNEVVAQVDQNPAGEVAGMESAADMAESR